MKTLFRIPLHFLYLFPVLLSIFFFLVNSLLENGITESLVGKYWKSEYP